ncbi:MAG: transaldolase [Sedimentisphaerales bacterium]|nr:transaldolase [Sedimentisphaerales bacterium]
MPSINGLKIKLFADGADIENMKQAYADGIVKGFTTNPTLMRKANVSDYEAFAREAIAAIPDLPISFEVFSDEFSEMESQARWIHSWGRNVIIKIPITNTRGESSLDLIKKLSDEGISLNITAILTLQQVEQVVKSLNPSVNSIVSVFAGRIADAGLDPEPIMVEAAKMTEQNAGAELLWASCRELFNIFHAERCGCQIITVTADILRKLPNIGRDLADFSLDTVRMFYRDAQTAGYKMTAKPPAQKVVSIRQKPGAKSRRDKIVHS